MYIKIKNPERFGLMRNFFLLGWLSIVLLASAIFLTVTSDSITTPWHEVVSLVSQVKQEDGILAAGFSTCCIIILPIALAIGWIAGIKEWREQQRYLNNPTTISALRFGPEGVTVYTRQNTYLLPYNQTDFQVTSEVTDAHTNNGRYAALVALDLKFSQEKQHFHVRQKPTIELLCKLADFHPRFKKSSFEFVLSSPNDSDQQSLAGFLKEQVENQIQYGMHCQYRSYSMLILCVLLLIALGTIPLWLSLAVGFDPHSFIAWISAGMGVALFVAGLILAYKVLKEIWIICKLKQLRHQ